MLWGREGLRPSAKSVRHQAASPFVIPAHAGIHLDPAVALDIRTRSKIKMGPSVRWDDGMVDRYFRFLRFFRLAGWPRGSGDGRPWSCLSSTRRPARSSSRRTPGSILILLLPWISGQKNRIRLGPSVRWDDGVFAQYFRFFRLAG